MSKKRAKAQPKGIDLYLPKPHEAQERVIAESRRFNTVCCGRRWGKSTLGIDRLIQPALAGFPVGWFSPTYKSLGESWREVRQILQPATTSKAEQEHRLELVTGGKVEMWSLDSADLVRGRKYKLAVIDEAALIPNLGDAWQFVIRPTLADMQGGAWFLSTPRGMNFFKTIYDYGQDPLKPDWASWQMPTVTNPFIRPEEIEAARGDMAAAAFSQEFEGSFISWEGSVFRRITDCATGAVQDKPIKNHQYTFGVDWGRSLDYTVTTVIDANERRMVYMDRSNRQDYTLQRGRLAALNQLWQPAVILAESNSIGQPVIEQLLREGLPVVPFMTTNASKAVIIEALALAFERGDITILNESILISELQAFAAEQLPSGLMRYTAPAGQHDDTVISLALAWHAATAEDSGDRMIFSDDPASAEYGLYVPPVQISKY
ncbi:MAG TPA: terminase family protein [Bryobacteraceae bacterium]|nr:terminase family protein [Bryobacteraceae bacterium]